MQRRTIPGTQLEVSVIGFGCWAIGGEYWGDDVVDVDSIDAVHAALDCGINLFDTAPLYGHGHADEVLSHALGAQRHDVVIATKVGVDTRGEHARSDLSRAHLIADVESSLRRLRLETLPLAQIHWPDQTDTPLAESLDTLQALQDAGKIQHYGVCNYGAADVRRIKQTSQAVSLQTPYSMVRREYEGELERALLRGPAWGMLAYEPLCRGLLTGKFKTRPEFPDTDLRRRDDRFSTESFTKISRLVQGLAHVADALGTTTAALALAWVAHRGSVTSALVGAKRRSQVLENVRAAELLSRAQDREPPWSVLDRMANAIRI